MSGIIAITCYHKVWTCNYDSGSKGGRPICTAFGHLAASSHTTIYWVAAWDVLHEATKFALSQTGVWGAHTERSGNSFAGWVSKVLSVMRTTVQCQIRWSVMSRMTPPQRAHLSLRSVLRTVNSWARALTWYNHLGVSPRQPIECWSSWRMACHLRPLYCL